MVAEGMFRSSRVADWRIKLNAHIAANRDLRHSYDSTKGLDCARWTASCRTVVTGRKYDVSTAKYKSEKGALLYLTRNGCKTVEQLAEKVLGPRLAISFAGAGDAVLADLSKMGLAGDLPQIGLVLGICNGRTSYFVGESGLIEIPTLSLECCFHG